MIVSTHAWLAAALAAHAGAAAPGGSCAQPYFAGFGENPSVRAFDLAPTDFDADGDIDLVVVQLGFGAGEPDGLEVLLNDGTGVFTSGGSFSGGAGGLSVSLLDADNDGDLDAATADDDLKDVLYWERDGAGFLPPVAVTAGLLGGAGVGQGASDLDVGDFNLDGFPDIAVARYGAVSILINDGTGSFTIGDTLFITGAANDDPRSIAVGDLNNDGRPDVVAPLYESANQMGVFLNLEEGFAEPTLLVCPDETGGVDLGDTDADGDLDIVLVSDEDVDGTFRIYRNAGDGATFSVQQLMPADEGLSEIVLADLDGDGFPEAAISNRFDEDLHVYVNNGSGGFGGQFNYQLPPLGDTYGITAADFNADGAIDIATADWGVGAVLVLINTCPPPAPPCPGDLSGDADVDSDDLNALLAAFGVSDAGDLDDDGDTDSADLNILLANFGSVC